MISAVRGSLDNQSIGEQLRVSWPDDELTNRDKKQGKGGRHRDRGRVHAGWEEDDGGEDEDEDGDGYYDDSEADHDTHADDTEDNDEEPLYTAEEIEEAETAFAAQQRSFEEARDLLRRVKTARPRG